MQVGRIAFSTRFVAISGTGSWGDLRDRLLRAISESQRAISGTGSWVRLMGYFGIAPTRSLSSVLSVQYPEVTQKDHVRPEKLRLPAIESRF